MADLEGRISVGLSLAMSEDEHRALLDEFGRWISELYFSPPLGPNYHTRAIDHELFQQPGVEATFWSVLALARQRGIRLCLALNSSDCTAEDMVAGAKVVQERVGLDSVVTLRKGARRLKSALPEVPLYVSFNEGIDSEAMVDKIDAEQFAGIVPGRSTLRNFRLFRYMKSKGFGVKFMLNAGCSFYCEGCQCRGCYRPRRPQNDQIASLTSWDERYALQTLMPWELHSFGYLDSEDIDLFKVCSRPAKYVHLRATLDSYIHNRNAEVRVRDQIAYYLWARGNILPSHFHELDYERIRAAKETIWADEAYRTFGRVSP